MKNLTSNQDLTVFEKGVELGENGVNIALGLEFTIGKCRIPALVGERSRLRKSFENGTKEIEREGIGRGVGKVGNIDQLSAKIGEFCSDGRPFALEIVDEWNIVKKRRNEVVREKEMISFRRYFHGGE